MIDRDIANEAIGLLANWLNGNVMGKAILTVFEYNKTTPDYSRPCLVRTRDNDLPTITRVSVGAHKSVKHSSELKTVLDGTQAELERAGFHIVDIIPRHRAMPSGMAVYRVDLYLVDRSTLK